MTDMERIAQECVKGAIKELVGKALVDDMFVDCNTVPYAIHEAAAQMIAGDPKVMAEIKRLLLKYITYQFEEMTEARGM